MDAVSPPSWRSRRPPPPLSDYFCLADGHTAALVDRRGRCDFLCWPRFDSPIGLGRLLDADQGGSVGVLGGVRGSVRAGWRGRSRVLRIEWDSGLTVESALIQAGGASSLVWLVSGPTGAPVILDLQHPRAGGGPDWQLRPDGAVLDQRGRPDGPGGPLRVLCGAPLESHPSGALLRLPPDGLVVRLVGPDGFGRAGSPSEGRRELERLHDDDEAWVEDLLRRDLAHLIGDAPGWASSMVERSLLTLRGLQDRASGLLVASPLTSIPQWPGSARAWDYRYAWLRDCSDAGIAFCRAGALQEAGRLAQGLASQLGPKPLDARPVSRLDGSPLPEEHRADHLEGYGGSPVRVGNAAADQVQLDTLGEVLRFAAILAERAQAPRELMDLVPPLADAIVARWRLPDHGIWEVRGEPHQYLHSKLVCGSALEAAAALGDSRLAPVPQRSWRDAAQLIRESIAVSGTATGLPMAEDDPSADGALLASYLVDFPDPKPDAATLDRVLEELGQWPLVARHHPERDGIPGPCAPFVFAGLWAAAAEARLGRAEMAKRRLRAICSLSGPAAQLSEVADPAVGRMLGNFPQVQSHAALLEAVGAVWGRAPQSRVAP